MCRRWPDNGDDYNKETHLKTCSTFLEQTKKSFADLSFTMTEIDPALKHIEVEGGRSTLEVFQGEKVAKAIFSAIEIESIFNLSSYSFKLSNIPLYNFKYALLMTYGRFEKKQNTRCCN